MAGKKGTTNVDVDDELDELPRRVEFVVTQPEPPAALGEIQAGIGRLEQRIGELVNVLTATVTAQKPHQQNPAPAEPVAPAAPPAQPVQPVQPVQIVQPAQPAAPAPAAKSAQTSTSTDVDLTETTCPGCGERFLVTDGIWGAWCPGCGEPLRVDLADDADEDAVYDFPTRREMPEKAPEGAPKQEVEKPVKRNPGLLGVFKTDFDRRYAQLLDG